MKILMTADPIGGVWNFALDLCALLAADDTAISLVTLGGPVSDVQRTQLAALPHVSHREGPWRLEWMPEPWADVDAAGEWLLAEAARFRPDVVHLNHLVHGDLPWQVPVLTTGHSCVLSWWRAVHRAPVPALWHEYSVRVTRSLRAADHVVAPTGAMLASLGHHYGPFRRATVLPNARRLPVGNPPAGAQKAPVVLCAGRGWDPAKNIGALDRVAPSIAWPVVFAGDLTGPDGQAMRFPALHCVGRLGPGELADLQNRAAIFAAPARYEPFGLAPLESAMAGCALVLGDIASLREVWGDAALYVDPDDTRGLRAVLGMLISDASLRRSRGARARRRAARYTPRRFATGYRRLYSALRPGWPRAAIPTVGVG